MKIDPFKAMFHVCKLRHLNIFWIDVSFTDLKLYFTAKEMYMYMALYGFHIDFHYFDFYHIAIGFLSTMKWS